MFHKCPIHQQKMQTRRDEKSVFDGYSEDLSSNLDGNETSRSDQKQDRSLQRQVYKNKHFSRERDFRQSQALWHAKFRKNSSGMPPKPEFSRNDGSIQLPDSFRLNIDKEIRKSVAAAEPLSSDRTEGTDSSRRSDDVSHSRHGSGFDILKRGSGIDSLFRKEEKRKDRDSKKHTKSKHKKDKRDKKSKEKTSKKEKSKEKKKKSSKEKIDKKRSKKGKVLKRKLSQKFKFPFLRRKDNNEPVAGPSRASMIQRDFSNPRRSAAADRQNRHRSLEISKTAKGFEIGDDVKRKSTRHSMNLSPLTSPNKRIKSLYVGSSVSNQKRVFGQPLSSLVSIDNPIPLVVKQCIEFLVDNGLEVEGLLRISASQENVRNMINKFDSGEEVSFKGKDPHDVAGLLKAFLRDIKGGLIPSQINNQVRSLIASYHKEKKDADTEQKLLLDLRDTIESLPRTHYDLLKYILGFLRKVVEHKDKNLMTLDNIIRCIVPNLNCEPSFFYHPINHYDFFFGESNRIKKRPATTAFPFDSEDLFDEQVQISPELLELLQEEEKTFPQRRHVRRTDHLVFKSRN